MLDMKNQTNENISQTSLSQKKDDEDFFGIKDKQKQLVK